MYKNGEILTPPVKVELNKHLQNSYESVLNEVTLKVKLQNGAVLRYIYIFPAILYSNFLLEMSFYSI